MNAGAAEIKGYGVLLKKALPTVIRSEAQNERCVRELERLSSQKHLSGAEQEFADLLTVLIEDYEEKHYAMAAVDPLQVIRELMSQHCLKQKDLVDVFKTTSIASEVLKGRRKLTVAHIRKLSERFHISPAVLL